MCALGSSLCHACVAPRCQCAVRLLPPLLLHSTSKTLAVCVFSLLSPLFPSALITVLISGVIGIDSSKSGGSFIGRPGMLDCYSCCCCRAVGGVIFLFLIACCPCSGPSAFGNSGLMGTGALGGFPGVGPNMGVSGFGGPDFNTTRGRSGSVFAVFGMENQPTKRASGGSFLNM